MFYEQLQINNLTIKLYNKGLATVHNRNTTNTLYFGQPDRLSKRLRTDAHERGRQYNLAEKKN